jgi:hypothetical protein
VTVKPARTSEVLVSGFSVVPLRSGAGAEITFGLSGEATVDVGIVNVAGRLVHRLRQGVAAEVGTHTVVWSGRSTTGAALPSGTYMCVLRATTPDGRRATAVRPITISR